MTATPLTSPQLEEVERSQADRIARQILRLPVDAPKQSIFNVEDTFGKSIAVSAIRCLVTYVFLPLLAPFLGGFGFVGPVLGLLLGAVSTVAIVFSMRRFFAADHKWRWAYSAVGVAILIMLIISAVVDISNLVG